MTSPLWISIATALLMAGLLTEALIFRAIHADLPSIYKLFALRDKLVRLVIEGKIDRHEPHFDALYTNVTLLLESSRSISGPHGWHVAEAQGKYLAHDPGVARTPAVPPDRTMPESLLPVIEELRAALEHLIDNHLGVLVQLNSHRREAARIQRAQAKALLKRVLEGDLCAV